VKPIASAWLVAAPLWPLLALLVGLMAGGRYAARLALAAVAVGLGIAMMVAAPVLSGGDPLVYFVGDWLPPLGIGLQADGLAAVMLITTAVIIGAAGLYALHDYSAPAGSAETRTSLAFWTLLLAVWGAMNLVVLGRDLFNLYVALELLSFAAVPLVCIDGRRETLTAALRYLMFALFGSALYLLGAVLLYGVYGTLDIGLLAERVRPGPGTGVAAVLITVGLLAKTALFPLHFWLPPAHAGAPAAASAVLSALVVKGSFIILLRFWFEAMPGVWNVAAAQLLATLGDGAILYGSILALRQQRLKMLIAYSTVAQIGYLFLLFPLAFDTASGTLQPGSALAGGLLQVVSHALAKAGMFLAAGLIALRLGHDRVGEMAGLARTLPVSVLAFALAGVSLIGLPPSGGFAAKWLLLSAAVSTGQWWWAMVLVVGGVLTGGYLALVLLRALQPAAAPLLAAAPVARSRELVALALALAAALLGLALPGPLADLAVLDDRTLAQAAR
jgi:formate hydrogenlyase subunit 3/multisubunit Na+/H+ antiporter MnhD subunit